MIHIPPLFARSAARGVRREMMLMSENPIAYRVIISPRVFASAFDSAF